MPKYKFTTVVFGYTRSGEVVADSVSGAKSEVATIYRVSEDDVRIIEEGETKLNKVAETAAVGFGCLGIGIMQILFSALPIAVALLIVIGILRSCS
jgi:hypothetical protein